MKSERRRNVRVAVQIPVQMTSPNLGGSMKVTTIDVSEGGMAVSLPKPRIPVGRWNIGFTLPGSASPLELLAEFAWEGSGKQAGLRFMQTSRRRRVICANGCSKILPTLSRRIHRFVVNSPT
jgi:PilZ domain.